MAAGCPANPATTVNTQKYSSPPPMTIDTSKNYTATVKTTAGTFTIALDAKNAPITVNNFVFLADKLLPLRDLPPGHPGLRGPDR